MARPPKPLADPVTIDSNHRVWFWESGLVGQGERRSKRNPNRAQAETFANAKRTELMALRALMGLDGLPKAYRTINDAFDAWLKALEDNQPRGTFLRYRQEVDHRLNLIAGNRCGEFGLKLYDHILRSCAAEATTVGPLEATRTAMNAFITWAMRHDNAWIETSAISAGEMQACFNTHIDSLRRRVSDSSAKQKAQAKANASHGRRSSELHDGDADDHIGIGKSPTWDHHEALARAIQTRESMGDPERVHHGRGSRGGAPLLSLAEAWRIGQSIPFAGATGMRECELLVAHTSNVDLETGLILVEFQLDRYAPWQPGEAPPVTMPKGNKTRTTQCFGSYKATLTELCEYADANQRGWLFAPTRGQKWWAKGWEQTVNRGIALQQWAEGNPAALKVAGLEEVALSPVWTWRRHYARHHYGSQALAPTSVGGYGWPEKDTSEYMGHSVIKTTQDLYQHRVGINHRFALESSMRRPGVCP